MTWIRFYLSFILTFLGTATEQTQHLKSIMKLKINLILKNQKIVLMIFLNFWQCWTRKFLTCKTVADIRNIFLSFSKLRNKKQNLLIIFTNELTLHFFYFTFPCFLSLFTLQLLFFFLLSHRLQINTFPFTPQKINIPTEPALLRLATVICLKDWFHVQNIGKTLFASKIKYWT